MKRRIMSKEIEKNILFPFGKAGVFPVARKNIMCYII